MFEKILHIRFKTSYFRLVERLGARPCWRRIHSFNDFTKWFSPE